MRSFEGFAVGRARAYLCAAWVALYASSALAQAAAPPSAGGPAGYRALIGEALAEFERGNAAESRALFMRAHAVNPSARTLRGLGLSSFELRDYRAAVDYLEQSLGSTVNPLTDVLRERTEGLLQKARGFVGRYQVRLDPPHARLRVDGAPAVGGQALVLDVGTHELLAEATGHLSARHTVRVNGGENAAIDIALVAVAPPAQQVASARTEVPAPALAGDGERPSTRPLYRNGWLWTGVGLAVAAVGAAVGVAARRGTKTQVGEPTVTDATPNGGVFAASRIFP